MNENRYPITVLFATLKTCGISNRKAATVLLDPNVQISEQPVSALIESRSRLSRRIVHAAPDELPAAYFADFSTSASALAERATERCALEYCKGNLQRGAQKLIHEKIAPAHKDMAAALKADGSNTAAYRDAVDYIKRISQANPIELATLHFLAHVVAGCTADGQLALSQIAAFAADRLELDFATAKTYIDAPAKRKGGQNSAASFCIARIRDGVIAAGTKHHPIGPAGLIIGLVPHEEPATTDVASDVSRRHARLWVEGGSLFITDLGSTNGTSIIGTGSGSLAIVAPPKSLQSETIMQAVELHYGDIICLGATTRYIVLPGFTNGGPLFPEK